MRSRSTVLHCPGGASPPLRLAAAREPGKSIDCWLMGVPLLANRSAVCCITAACPAAASCCSGFEDVGGLGGWLQHGPKHTHLKTHTHIAHTSLSSAVNRLRCLYWYVSDVSGVGLGLGRGAHFAGPLAANKHEACREAKVAHRGARGRRQHQQHQQEQP